MKYTITGLFMILGLSLNILAQDAQTEAKYLFKKVSVEIDEGFRNGSLSDSYSLKKQLNQIENLLGGTNAALEYYRAKVDAADLKIRSALLHVNSYFKQNRSNDLWDEDMIMLKNRLKNQYSDYTNYPYLRPKQVVNGRVPSPILDQENRNVRMISVDGSFQSKESFDYIHGVYEGMFYARKSANKYWIDLDGDIIIEQNEYEKTHKTWSEGYLGVVINGKWGYIDSKGKVKIDCKFDDAFSFSEGFAHVKKAGEDMIIDENGNIVFRFLQRPENEVHFYNSWGRIKLGSGVFYMNSKGNTINNQIYESGKDFSDGFAAIKVNGKWGFIDRNGTMRIQPQYKRTFGFQEGIAIVTSEDNKEFLINKSGDIIKDVSEFNSINNCSSGLLQVSKRQDNGGFAYGYLDKNGDVRIPIIYEYADPLYSDGFTVVGKYGSYGIINTEGNFVIKRD